MRRIRMPTSGSKRHQQLNDSSAAFGLKFVNEFAATHCRNSNRRHSIIPKTGTGLRKRSCSNDKLKRRDDSKSHPAVETTSARPARSEQVRPTLFDARDKRETRL